MAESVQDGLIQAVQVAREAAVRQAANGVRYAAFGDNNLEDKDLERMVQAVPRPLPRGSRARLTISFRWR